MMNRVFAPDAAIDLEPLAPDPEASRAAPSPHRPLPPAAATPGAPSPAAQTPVVSTPLRAAAAPSQGPAAGATPKRSLSELTVVLGAMLAGVGLVGALGAVLLVQQWAGLQRNLSQERNLLLVERLRALGPATAPPDALATPPAPVLDPTPATAGAAPLPPQAPAAAPAQTRAVASFDGLPPPPPEEPWMAQLAALPPTGGRAPLRVPVSPRLTAVAPAAVSSPLPPRPAPPARTVAARSSTAAPLPQLVGLVGAPGRAGSAIFQIGTTAMSVNVGEQIGSSGWLLRAADGESAVIERGTEVRRIAIVAGG